MDNENTQATDQVNFDTVIYNAMLEDGVLTPAQIAFAIDQCRLETDNYTSNVFKADNNLNGYKYVNSQFQDGPGLVSPEGDNYGHYSCVENSAHELSYWWQRRAQKNGFDLSTLVDIPSYANALKQFGWYGSDALAYAQRMQAVALLVNVENATGLNTQGISNTALLIGVGVMLFLIFK
jgi:hypothetical protein